MTNNNFINLDVLRVFAVISVLVFHYFPSYAPWGFVGVDVFIFLSGYLLEGKLSKGQSIRLFFVRRIIRVFPPLIITILILIILGWFVLFDKEYSDLVMSSIFSLFGLANFYQGSLDGYFSGDSIFRPLLHLWSLSIEMQFYILIGVSYIIWRTLKARIIVLIFLILSSFLVSLFFSEGSFSYFNTITRLWEFMFGALAYHFSWSKYSKVSWSVAIVGFLATLLLIKPDSVYPGYLTILPLLISWGMVQVNLNFFDKFFSVFFRFLASISYGLFLVHLPLLVFLKQFIGQPSPLLRVAFIFVSLVAAWFIEQFIIKRFKFFSGVKGIFFSFGLLLFLIFIVKFSLPNVEREIETRNSALLSISGNFELAKIEACGLSEYIEERCRGILNHGEILLLGDSVSHALTPAFDKLVSEGKVKSYSQVGAGSCPPFFDHLDQECLDFWGKYFEFFEIGKKPMVIFIAGQWPLYFDMLKPSERADVSSSFVSNLENFISEKTIKVIFVKSPPLGAHPKACLDRVLLLSSKNCNIPYEVALRRKSSESKLSEQLSSLKGVKIFDPWDSLCGYKECDVKVGNKLLYLDDSHFSKTGAEYLSMPLLRTISSL